MLIRVKYQPHPLRPTDLAPGLPSWGLFGHDPVEQTAILDIPDDDMPPEWNVDGSGRVVATHVGPVLVEIPPARYEAWHSHLDAKYQEHQGEYRPQLA